MPIVITSDTPLTFDETGGVLSMVGTFPLALDPFDIYLEDGFNPAIQIGASVSAVGETDLDATIPPATAPAVYSVSVVSVPSGGDFAYAPDDITITGGDSVDSGTPLTFGNLGGTITITGTFGGTEYYIRLDDAAVTEVGPVDPTGGDTLEFELPAGIEPGTYELLVWRFPGDETHLADTLSITITSDASEAETPDGVVTETAPVAVPTGRFDRQPVTYWTAREGVDPAEAWRDPWSTIGLGGVVEGSAIEVTGASPAGFRRTRTGSAPRERLELQCMFSGSTSSPLWSSGASGHVIAIDDGERTLGVSIGETLQVLHPETGDILWTLPQDSQPGGWTTRRAYHLVKLGTAWWELYVDGRIVFRLPYRVAALTQFGAVTWSWGWLDATAGATGVGEWDRVETGDGLALPPIWKVDRARSALPAYLAARWSPRHEAMLRASIGIAHQNGDRMVRVGRDAAAGVGAVSTGRLDGSALPSTVDGWEQDGAAPTIVRGRVRFEPSGDPSLARWVFPDPVEPSEAIYYAAATITLRSVDTVAAAAASGRAGPIVSIRDGSGRAFSAVVLISEDNADRFRLRLTDGPLGGALESVGEVAFPVAGLDLPHRIELYVVEADRVILVVDGELVEDVDYGSFTGPAADDNRVFDARVGGDDVGCVVDVEAVEVRQSLADPSLRALFLRRVAERCVFSGGLEGNGRLDVWSRQRWPAFRARGTPRVLSELRRLSSDETELHSERIPATWYLDVTWPEITPTFLTETGFVANETFEYHAIPPNFTRTTLEALFRRYMLPRSVVENRSAVAITTALTSTTTTSGTTTFDVEDGTEFAAGDPVTLRKATTGTILTLEYDTAPADAADTMDVGVAEDGTVYSQWTASGAGLGSQIGGTVAKLGLDGDRTNPVTAGGTVEVRGVGATVDVVVEVIGVLSGSAVAERLPCLGTATRAGVQTWTTVHGAICTPEAQDDVEIVDTSSGDVLYTIAAGDRSSGVHLFDPELTTGASVMIVADAATTADVVLGGVEDGASNVVDVTALNGTTPVTITPDLSRVRYLAVGYLAAARTITLGGRVQDPGATTIDVVSSSASDVQRVVVVYHDTNGEAQIVEGVLDGTTPVSIDLPTSPHRIAGVVLGSDAVGTVTVSTVEVDAIATITAGNRSAGIREYKIGATGPVTLTADADPSSPRYAAVFGLDEDGDLSAELLEVGTSGAASLTDWSEIQGIACGGVDGGVTLTTSGLAWRFSTWEDCAIDVSERYGWSVTGPADVVFDGVLQSAVLSDVSAGPVAFDGAWSELEDAEVVSVVESGGTWTIETSPLELTFDAGDVVRFTPSGNGKGTELG